MRDILLTSSVLILALLILRRIFQNSISRRVQYALWALAALRLLLPVSLPAADFSVLSISQPVQAGLEAQMGERPLYVLPLETVPAAPPEAREEGAKDPAALSAAGHTVVSADGASVTTYALTAAEAAGLAWRMGTVGMLCWLVISNFRFWRRLRKNRTPCPAEGCRYRVWLVEEGLASPCLFGLFRPAVYLTPAALASPETLRHVLTHEETHARHLDPLWSLVRCLCLAVYWFDPLVWWAAAAAKADCELACDEGAIRRLGEGERVAYGRTLLSLVPVRRGPMNPMLSATTMASGKRRLRERITRIAENRKTVLGALCTAAAMVALVCALTFTGCAAGKGDSPNSAEPPLPAGSTAYPSWEPALRVSLEELAPYEAPAVERREFTGSYEERVGGDSITEHHSLFLWRAGDGNIYVSTFPSAMSSWPTDYFLTFRESGYGVEPFTGLFGRDGMVISYQGEISPNYYDTISDYYVFTESETEGSFPAVEVTLLARTYGRAELVDLDGDGTRELAASTAWRTAQLFFQREGQVWEADLSPLLAAAWPEAAHIWFGAWDAESRSLAVNGNIPFPGHEDDPASAGFSACRSLYFDGESLLLYRDQRTTTDHLLEGVEGPDYAITAAKERAQASFDQWLELDWPGGVWDDWRIASLEPISLPEVGKEMDTEAYRFSYHFHSATPEQAMMAGGMSLQEDGWVRGLTDSPYLLFLKEGGQRIVLDCNVGFDVDPEGPLFLAEYLHALMLNGVLAPSEASGESLYCLSCWMCYGFLEDLAAYPAEEQEGALRRLVDYARSDAVPQEDEGLLRSALEADFYDLSEGAQTVLDRLRAMVGVSVASVG